MNDLFQFFFKSDLYLYIEIDEDEEEDIILLVELVVDRLEVFEGYYLLLDQYRGQAMK